MNHFFLQVSFSGSIPSLGPGAQGSFFKNTNPPTCDTFLKRSLNQKYFGATFNFLALAILNVHQFCVWSVLSNPRNLKPALKCLQTKNVCKNVSHSRGLFQKKKPDIGKYCLVGTPGLLLWFPYTGWKKKITGTVWNLHRKKKTFN